jgi:hypothetical protein
MARSTAGHRGSSMGISRVRTGRGEGRPGVGLRRAPERPWDRARRGRRVQGEEEGAYLGAAAADRRVRRARLESLDEGVRGGSTKGYAGIVARGDSFHTIPRSNPRKVSRAVCTERSGTSEFHRISRL